MVAEGDSKEAGLGTPSWMDEGGLWFKLLPKADQSSYFSKLPNIFWWKDAVIKDGWSLEDARTPKGETAGLLGDQGHKHWTGLGPNLEYPEQSIFTPANKEFNPVKYPHPEAGIGQHLIKRYHSPHYRNFLTDMGANILNLQGGRCQDFELQAMECIEYYGAKQGLTACKDWYDDYIECMHGCKQRLRVQAMFKKRHIDNHLEYLQGKRTWAETYEPPPKSHAFTEPWFSEKYQNLQQREG